MKKLLFAAYSLDLGGIEKALVTLVNKLQEKEYEITIVLEKKQGIFLEELNKNIQIIEYRPSENKNKLKRKITNLFKRIKFIKEYKNKFDFSACFATYSNVAAFVARTASKNSALWGHADYTTLYQNNIKEVKQFFQEKKYQKFKHIIFVSQEGKNAFIKIFPKMEERTIVCNNLIEYKKIKELAEESVDWKKDKNKVTFVNVGRHEERQKKLTRLIRVAKKLKENKQQFQILLIGDGPEHEMYKQMVKNEKLEDVIFFLGKKVNPYPYFKLADCMILTSEYEGYPVVFLESFILNKPIITTKVSDYKEVENQYGIVTEKNEKSIYEAMNTFIEKGFTMQTKFDANQYNEEIIKKLEQIF